MDIQREEFWEWATSENPLLVDEAKSGSQFHKDVLDYMFMGWLAKAQKQAIPDDFVLVPREPTERMLDASRRRQWDELSLPMEDMDYLKYKAMIKEGEIK